MSKNYNNLSIEELRELLLCGELIHENMHEEDYAILIDNELELQEPDNEVIRLCTSALSKYDSYSELDKINIDINRLINQPERKITPIKHRKLRKASLIAAAVIATLLITQIITVAMGFNLFGYIFDWCREILVIRHESESPQDELFDEVIFEAYEKISDMPKDIVALLPFETLDDFKFFFGSTEFYSDRKFNAVFGYMLEYSDEVFLLLNISKGLDIHIEKDDELFEEYETNGTVFTLYKNLELYKATWISDGVLFDMGVNLSLDELKAIIDNFR
jgi:hypothetical protein